MRVVICEECLVIEKMIIVDVDVNFVNCDCFFFGIVLFKKYFKIVW